MQPRLRKTSGDARPGPHTPIQVRSVLSPSGSLRPKCQQRTFLIPFKISDVRMMSVQQAEHLKGRAIADTKPDHFGRCTAQQAQLLEVRVFGEYAETIVTGIEPQRMILGTVEAKVHGMHRTRIAVL